MLTCDGISYKITVIICIQSECFLLCCSWAAYYLIEKNVRYHYFAQSRLDALYILQNKYIHYVFYNMETYCLVFPFLYEGGLGSWKGKFEKHERRKRQNIKEVKEGNWNITYLNQHSYWEFQWQHEIIISEKMFARRTFSWFSFSDRTWMVASQKNNLFVVLERSL